MRISLMYPYLTIEEWLLSLHPSLMVELDECKVGFERSRRFELVGALVPYCISCGVLAWR